MSIWALLSQALVLACGRREEDEELQYAGWFLVFIAVLIALGAVMIAGMAVWCVVNQHGAFTGEWRWVTFGISTSIRCTA
ncbi:hypothetical protein F6S87_04355 [Bifidobacterium sp. BRDM6]|uniref:Uncharacterized protein n=1 Tax=Bifidobacterium choloepi TaxID=2614131 RepID=A0A6I5N034_9BIFI|nr:hypothetical protein [Bifidobacterium choloepi]